jgi:hypothetical protein
MVEIIYSNLVTQVTEKVVTCSPTAVFQIFSIESEEAMAFN